MSKLLQSACRTAEVFRVARGKTPSLAMPLLNGPHNLVSQTDNKLLRRFCSTKPQLQRETVTVHFMKTNGEKESVKAKIGDNLLDVIVDNNVDVDGFGACEGTLACSTCHLIFKPEDFGKIEEKATDEELDMLDLAYGLTDYSRLGCQVCVTKDMEGWEIRVPEGVADARDV